MMYSLLFLTALLSQFRDGGCASSQTRAMTGRGSMAALNNLVVIGDPTAEDLSFSYYSYLISNQEVAVNDYVQGLDGTATNTLITLAAGDVGFDNDKKDSAFTGFGAAVAIADANTVFVSQTSTLAQTGRVIVYEGNITSFTGTQLLIPSDGAHRQDSDAAFGESIDAKADTLAVGCQLCNSSAPVHSGAVYVYKPTPGGRWSESQVLNCDGVYFLGEHVAMHDKVLIAAGDDYSSTQLSQHDVSNIANTVAVFEEQHDGKFEGSQVLITNKGSNKESITSITVFDETIAVATMGADTSYTSGSAADKIYVYYPTSERYGLSAWAPRDAKSKPKPAPQQWTNTQILTSSTGERYVAGSSDSMVSISQNSLRYISYEATGDSTVIFGSTRQCLSCSFPTDPTSEVSVAVSAFIMLTADHNDFYSYGADAGTTTLINDPVANTLNEGCLIISLQDQYNDGWGIANLVVDRPDGFQDKFTLQCTTANPNIFKYCPNTQHDGVYHFHIENGEETPYGWEIVWKVSAHGAWYYGDRHTRMDFIWDTKYNDFHVGATKEVLPLYDTCEICDPNPPSSKPRPKRRLGNLRSLHHKGASSSGSSGTTSSPTISSAPTIATGTSTDYWNQIRMIGAAAADIWFDASYNGANFWVASADGSKLFHTGTSCSAVNSDNARCYLALPDGDYKLRVGSGVDEATRSTDLTYQFCYASNPIRLDTELSFTVLNGECYAGSLRDADFTCTNDYKSAFFLRVDVLLGGSTSTLSTSDESTLSVAVSETLQSVLGTAPSSSRISNQKIGSSGVEASVLVKFESMTDTSALDNLVRETSSASSLLKYELIGSQSLSAHFLHGEVSTVRITSVSTATEEQDYSNVDESSFQVVTDHVWMTPSVEQSSSNFNAYAEYVAGGVYALVAVAAVLAVSLFVKRTMSSKVEEDGDDQEVSSFAPSTTDLESESGASKRVKLTTLPQRSVDIAGLKNLAGD